ncbi:MAG TPA: Ku protein [Candidatus Limnocylindrales bacterium]|nr:Ku protein [Candidatus Limnocylindrales bacterium]
MPRAMWRGAIQFGLVTIPVKLYLATEANAGLSFNLLHKTCLSRVQMRTYCPVDDEYISRADTVRGFEYAKGQYVVIGDEDLEAVPLKTVRSIEIELFVDAKREGHGAQFVKSAYYLEPEPIGRKAFYLLKKVLADEGLSAICKVVIKDREALAALNPYASTMLMTTLHWPDEVRALDDLELPEAEQEFKPAELAMARQLVAAMTGDFSADDYRDDYRQALMAVIEAKISGQEVVMPVAEAPASTLADLMSVLEASVAAARETRQAEEAGVAPLAKARKAAAKKEAKGASAKPAAKAAAARSAPAGSSRRSNASAAAAAEATPRAAARKRKSA